MQLKNSQTRFGLISIVLHWLIAVLMIGLIIVGLYMVKLPTSLEKLKLFGWHKEYGFLVLALAIIRLLWCLTNISPKLAPPAWEIIAARIVHWAFYGFMFAIPLTGWLITSAAGLPVSFFGLITLPNLIGPSGEVKHLFHLLHKWLAYALIATIVLHTVAALKHHFIKKDDVLRRMFP